MELLSILYYSLIRLLSKKAAKNHAKYNFWKIYDFLEGLKDSTQSKHNCVKKFDVRHDAKRYRVSQGIIGSWKMYFFSIIFFLNDSKFYDEERSKLS